MGVTIVEDDVFTKVSQYIVKLNILAHSTTSMAGTTAEYFWWRLECLCDLRICGAVPFDKLSLVSLIWSGIVSV